MKIKDLPGWPPVVTGRTQEDVEAATLVGVERDGSVLRLTLEFPDGEIVVHRWEPERT